MKALLSASIPICCVVAIVGGTTSVARANKRLAVPDMHVTGADPGLGRMLTEILTTEASSTPGLVVIGSSDIASMLGFEKQKELIGCTDNVACVAEIGGALGVDYLLISDLGLVGKTYVINLKLIDTGKVTVLKRIYRTVPGEPDALIDLVKQSLPEILATVTLGHAAPVAEKSPVPTPAEQAAPLPPSTLKPVAAPTQVAPGKAPLPATAPAPAAVTASGPTRWPAWTLVGLGGASLLVAAAFEVVASKQHNDSSSDTVQLASNFDLTLYDKVRQDTQGAHDNARRAAIFAASGVVVAAGGGLWLWLKPASPAVALAPVVDANTVGFALAGRF